jgi:hypothetical protein
LRLVGFAGETKVALNIDSVQPGPNRLEASITDRDGQPASGDLLVLARLIKLDEELQTATITLAPQGPGQYGASIGELALPGFWQVDVIVRQRGRLDVTVTFPLWLGEPASPVSDPAAVRALEQSAAALQGVRSWRELQQIADGAGGVAVTWVDAARPDRLRYRTREGSEGVFIGTTRYQRVGQDPWRKETIPRPVSFGGPMDYMKGARSVVLGRTMACETESCRIILWRAPGQTTEGPAATFAGWIGARTHLLHRLLMVASAHFMTLDVSRFNTIEPIEAPE